MGISQTDTLLRTAISAFLDDLRSNTWLFSDIFSDFTTNPYLKDVYKGQIKAATEWFLNNKIEVVLGFILPTTKLPCVTIIIGESPEMPAEKTMGDASTQSLILQPGQIGKPIPYVISPVVPTSYTQGTGTLIFPPNTPGLINVVPGQVVFNPANGVGFTITSVIPGGVTITAGTPLDMSQVAICCEYLFYKANIEHIWMNGNFDIICTAHGDPSVVIWLHDIVLYGLLRYKESLFEAFNLSQTVMNSGPLAINHDLSTEGGEFAWERTIRINGKIEQTFIKSPRRYLENIRLNSLVILANSEPPEVDPADNLWYTIDDPNDPET